MTVRRLAVTLHDVEPATFTRCALIRDWLEDQGVDRVTLLVIPAPDLHPFDSRRPELATWLAERERAGDAVAQHGFHHVRDDRRPSRRWGRGAEFVGLDAGETTRAIDAGRRVLKLAGLEPRGFVAPAYAYTPHLRGVLTQRLTWCPTPGTLPGVRALALTFDNLGEAADLERGHPPAGRHPSVAVLPWLLDALDERGLRATFFVEAINAEQHPQALEAIAARGHELGCHAWRHERWDALTPDEEADTLTRSLAALRELGLEVRGFRPPGGELNPGTPALLRAHGLDWCSPHGERSERRPDGLAVLPFRWPLVDAYHRLDHFASLREAHGDASAALDADATGARLQAELARLTAPTCLVLHPFLAADAAGAAALRATLDVVAGLDVEVAPGGVIAARLPAAARER